MSVVSSMPAPASSTNEAAIWVTANSRSRRLVPVVMRTPPVVRLTELAPSAVGSLGTKASRTAATRARAAPTQSIVASTVTSRARTE